MKIVVLKETMTHAEEEAIVEDSDREDRPSPPVADEVSTVLRQLVEHYEQPVHQETALTCSSDKDEGRKDALFLPRLSPVLQHLLDRLLRQSHHSRRPASVDATTLQLLLEGYRTKIRTTLHQTTPAVLISYELLIRHYVAHARECLTTEHSDGVCGTDSYSELLRLVSSDITMLTGENEDGNAFSALISSLWELVNSVLQCMSLLFPTHVLQEGRDAMRQCMCALLAFHSSRIDLRQVEPCLCHQPLFRTLVTSERSVWAYPPPASLGDDGSFVDEGESVMDWNRFVSDGTFWNDEKEPSSVMKRVWNQLSVLSVFDKATEKPPTPSSSLFHLQILSRFGWIEMARAIRAHFFAKDMIVESTTVVSKQRYRLHLGHLVPINEKQEQEERDRAQSIKPYQKTPSRLHAVLVFASLLDDRTLSGKEEILEAMVPICYELLDATREAAIGSGAVLTLRLWNMIMPPKQALAGGRTLVAPKSSLQTTASNLLLALDAVIQSSRDGCTLALVGLTQRALVHDTQRRRQVTQQWFMLLDKVRRVPTYEPKLVWGILVTLIPLLFDHAALHEQADALELGRLGLTTLLPLLRGDAGHRPARIVPILALVALSNLLVAAHPVMARHSPKIMCELLSCLRRTDDKQTRRLFVHVSAMAVVICGNAAATFLDGLLDAPYDAQLHDSIRVVQGTAETLRKKAAF